MPLPKDMEGIFRAARPRMPKVATSTNTSPVVPLPPHRHHARDIDVTPANRIASTDAEDAFNELDDEKLARDGTQTMLGDLDMNSHEIDNITNLNMNGGVGAAILYLVRRITMTGMGLIEAVRKIDFTGSVATEGIIDQPRVIHMAGDHADDEAKIDGLERVVFNDEVTASSIEEPSRIDFNVSVTAPVSVEGAAVTGDYSLPGGWLEDIPPAPDSGTVSWDAREDILVVQARLGDWWDSVEGKSKPQHGPVAVGWGVRMAVNNWAPV